MILAETATMRVVMTQRILSTLRSEERRRTPHGEASSVACLAACEVVDQKRRNTAQIYHLQSPSSSLHVTLPLAELAAALGQQPHLADAHPARDGPVDALEHVVACQQRHVGRRQRFHLDASHPLGADDGRHVHGKASTAGASGLIDEAPVDLALGDWQRVAEGNKLRRELGCLRRGDCGCHEDGALLGAELMMMTILPTASISHHFIADAFWQPERADCCRLAMRDLLARNIDHAGRERRVATIIIIVPNVRRNNRSSAACHETTRATKHIYRRLRAAVR
jgi:hypothetical protein